MPWYEGVSCKQCGYATKRTDGAYDCHCATARWESVRPTWWCDQWAPEAQVKTDFGYYLDKFPDPEQKVEQEPESKITPEALDRALDTVARHIVGAEGAYHYTSVPLPNEPERK